MCIFDIKKSNSKFKKKKITKKMKRKIIETKLVFISQREKKLWKFAIFEEYYKPKFVRMVSFFDERRRKRTY